MEIEEICLSDNAAWQAFVEANREEIESEYGSVDVAYAIAADGGLEMGGGATPLVIVYVGADFTAI